MKIVHVCVAGYQPMLSPSGGAIQRRILELAKVQARRGDDVTAFSVGTRSGVTEVDGVSVRFVRCLTPMPWRHVEYLVRILFALIRGPRPDVLNFHSQPEGAVIAKVLRLPAVLFYDNYFFRRGRKPGWWWTSYRRLLRSFDQLLPCSRYCLEESLAFWEIEEQRATVQYNGVNPAQFKPDPDAGAAERDRSGILGPVVLYVGRVNAQKGTDLLLEGFSLLRQRIPEASLVVAGPISQFGERSDPDDTSAMWDERIRSAGGIYLGAVAEERLAAVYNMADVFVMPTRALEMFGMAAVEAQSCGVPVVASDHGGLRETVPEAVGGRFPVGDVGALASRLQELLENETSRRGCGRAAIENAARFTWEQVTSDLDNIYAKAGIRA